MSERIKKMEDMAALEEGYALKYDESVMGLENVALRGLVIGVGYDSQKHAAMYRAIATILKGPLGVSDQEYEALEKRLKEHIEVEAKMLKLSKKLLDEEEDSRVKFLLEEIYADELRHHQFYKNLLEVVVSKDMIFQEDIFNQLWKDVPTHGAPRDPHAPGQ